MAGAHSIRAATAKTRLSSTWLVVNESLDALAWTVMDPRLRLAAVPNLDGLIAVRPLADVPAPAPGEPDTRFDIVDASTSDRVATMMLVIPQLDGRDLDDLDIEQRDGAEWLHFGSYLHRPIASVQVLAPWLPCRPGAGSATSRSSATRGRP